MKKIIYLFVIIFLLPQYGESQSIILDDYRTITIIPLGDVEISTLKYVSQSIKDFYGYKSIIGKRHTPTPELLSKSKTKYDADKIINEFSSLNYVLIISEYQIVILEHNIIETNIWGLGNCPGRTSVVSICDIKTDDIDLFNERVSKVCLHEIGHNIGLHHCTTTYKCIMNGVTRGLKELDAQNIWFCDKCKIRLEK